MTFVLSKRSNERLEGVHPALIQVVRKAIQITTVDFAVLEGVRTLERQKQLVAAGASRTMNSKHLKQIDGYAHAVDLGAYVDGEIRWDWPLYHKIAEAMKAAAIELKTPIVWGGNWTSFRDGPHYELKRV